MERQQHEHQPQDPLSVLRGVESTPPGDLEWAEHCTRQQAVILSLLLPEGRTTSLDALSEAVDVTIQLIDQLPVPSTSFPTADGWQIHVNAALPAEQQLRAALHQLKHVIDDPVRGPGIGAELTPAEYEQLADRLADMVLGEPTTPPDVRNQSGKEETS